MTAYTHHGSDTPFSVWVPAGLEADRRPGDEWGHAADTRTSFASASARDDADADVDGQAAGSVKKRHPAASRAHENNHPQGHPPCPGFTLSNNVSQVCAVIVASVCRASVRILPG